MQRSHLEKTRLRKVIAGAIHSCFAQWITEMNQCCKSRIKHNQHCPMPSDREINLNTQQYYGGPEISHPWPSLLRINSWSYPQIQTPRISRTPEGTSINCSFVLWYRRHDEKPPADQLKASQPTTSHQSVNANVSVSSEQLNSHLPNPFGLRICEQLLTPHVYTGYSYFLRFPQYMKYWIGLLRFFVPAMMELMDRRGEWV